MRTNEHEVRGSLQTRIVAKLFNRSEMRNASGIEPRSSARMHKRHHHQTPSHLMSGAFTFTCTADPWCPDAHLRQIQNPGSGFRGMTLFSKKQRKSGQISFSIPECKRPQNKDTLFPSLSVWSGQYHSETPTEHTHRKSGRERGSACVYGRPLNRAFCTAVVPLEKSPSTKRLNFLACPSAWRTVSRSHSPTELLYSRGTRS